MNSRRKGQTAEWRARDHLEAAGYYVVRAAGSHGPADLVALRGERVVLIQVKAVDTQHPFVTFRAELAALAAVPVTAHKELWLWVDRQGWRAWRWNGATWVGGGSL